MKPGDKITVIIAICLFMVLTVISFLIYNALSDNSPLYNEQEFEVNGIVYGSIVEGTCESELSSHSGSGNMIRYSVEFGDSSVEGFRFFLYFDSNGKPSTELYVYDKEQDEWEFTEDEITYLFKINGKQSIGSMKIQGKGLLLNLKEVVI